MNDVLTKPTRPYYRPNLDHPRAQEIRSILDEHEPDIQAAIEGRGHFIPILWEDDEGRAWLSLHILIYNPNTHKYEQASSHFFADSKVDHIFCYLYDRTKLGVRLDGQRLPKTLGELKRALRHFAKKLTRLKENQE